MGDALEHEQYELYQVTARMDDNRTIERETRALWELMAEQKLHEGTIIVGDGIEREYRNSNYVIKQVPAWKWFVAHEPW